MNFYRKFYPKAIFSSILDITPEFLRKNNIKAILLDVDNTLVDYDNNILDGAKEWAELMKLNGFKLCILSNTSKKGKAERMSKILDIPYIHFAKKPLKYGFIKAKKILEIDKYNEISAVGDQVMTDVYGANRCKIYSILVKPINSKDILVTRFNRIMERKILKEYYKYKKED